MRAGVIGDVVDQYLHAKLVRMGNERLIFLHGSHVVVEGVKIDDVVAVIVGVGILPDWGKPQGSGAEVVQISEMLSNAAQIAAVIRLGLSAVVDSGRARRLVVRRIA